MTIIQKCGPRADLGWPWLTAHIKRSYFRNKDFHVGFDYFKFFNDDMSMDLYTYYDADFGLRAMPRNNYKDAETAVDKELRRLLRFELNDKSFIKKVVF
jgi:hypothetical protein